MNLRWLLVLFAVVCLSFFQGCSNSLDEVEDTPSSIILRGGLFGTIRQTQDNFTSSETDGSKVNSSVKFQLFTNTDLDTILWVFPRANPNQMDGVLQAQTDFNGYGVFKPYVRMISIDSTSSNITRILIDSIFSRPIKVNYSLDDWNSFTTSGPDIWDNFGTSNILIGLDTLVDQSTDSLIIKKRFEGFSVSNKYLKFSYRISQNTSNNSKIRGFKKFSVLIDGFERFSDRSKESNQIHNITIPLNNKDQFDLSIVRYPSLYKTEWEISTDDPTSIDQETLTMYQPNENENSLVGYPSVTSTTTIMLNYGNYNVGSGSSKNELAENGDPITLLEGQYRLKVTLERGLPIRYSFIKDLNINDEVDRFKVFIYDFRIAF